MTARISGTSFTRQYILDRISNFDRRVKIVLVDLDINPTHQAISERFNFFTKSDSLRNHNSANDDNRFVEALHGSSCMAILKRNGSLSSIENMYWNMAPFADVFFLPLQPAKPMPANIAIDYAANVEEYYKRIKKISDTFDILLNASDDRRLQKGDVVVVTVGFNDPLEDTKNAGSGLFPLLHEDFIAGKVRELTCDREVSVIFSAGNMGTDLDSAHLTNFKGLRPFSQRKYKNFGVECGAIIVGAKNGKRAWARSNKGRCIDAYGPGEIEAAGNSSTVVDVPGSSIDVENGTIKASSIPLTWGDTSSAAVYVAAILANVQQVRLLEGFEPLRPYSARAHLRQWRAKEFGDGHKILPTPDALAWLLGTGVIDIDEETFNDYFTSQTVPQENGSQG